MGRKMVMKSRKIRGLSGGYAGVTIPIHMMEDLGWKVGERIEFERKKDDTISMRRVHV